MSDDGLIECGLCGRSYHSLGHHLARSHDITSDEYRDRFGIRRGTPLTSPATRARWSASIHGTIASGKLDAHYSGNGARAVEAAAASQVEKRVMRNRGIDLPHGTAATPRDVLEQIVVAIERGRTVAGAVKASPIGGSAFHAGLKRHPDLLARIDTLRGDRGKLRAGLSAGTRATRGLDKPEQE